MLPAAYARSFGRNTLFNIWEKSLLGSGLFTVFKLNCAGKEKTAVVSITGAKKVIVLFVEIRQLTQKDFIRYSRFQNE